MTNDTSLQAANPASQNETRDIDPNVRQRRAADPNSSVWVNASAGTGKTKVLTDRVLRLLLPRKDGQSGTKPHKIICLTFTKTAAAEMALRINKTLSKWVMMEQSELVDALEQLLGHTPTPLMLKAARTLFVEVLDSPGGLNIMTIHSFCQSILGRFPVEANLPPNFSVIEEFQAQIMLKRAINSVLINNAEAQHAITPIATQINENQFSDILKQLISESSQLKRILKNYSHDDDLQEAIDSALNAPRQKSINDIKADFCARDTTNLQTLCAALSDGGVKDGKIAAALQEWIEAAPQQRVTILPSYISALLTKAKEPRKISKGVISAHPTAANLYTSEVIRLLEMEDQCTAKENAQLTFHILKIGSLILQRYSHEKTKMAVLDYEDLIAKTLSLLAGDHNAAINTSWVLYKLDGGIDHMLVDESQDTNPEQWKIIEKLCDDFYDVAPDGDTPRTLFVVGDEKQSIYSFQRAAPAEFSRMKQYFKQRITQAGHTWHEEDMTISFRSTKSVLQLVDNVYAADKAAARVGTDVLPHISYRRGEAGHAEIWPLELSPEKEDLPPWTLPTQIRDTPSAQSVLAQKIATTIKEWIETKRPLPSKGRAISAGDILILVRTRTAFVNQLIKALKAHQIPISGADRLVLMQSLPVQDLMIAADFALLPKDDLALASLLKSPLCGLNDEDLFALAHGRKVSLLRALQEHDSYKAVADYCEWLIRQARQRDPYQFFADILYHPCPANTKNGLQAMQSRLGQDTLDPLEEFLNLVLNKQTECSASLQRVIQTLKSSNADIKRELEESGDMVRIMTVHGAKGLQAPVVFLPDTTRTHASKRINTLLWPDKTKLDVPVWSPRKASGCKAYLKSFESVEATLDDEYRRLLYVALTRAEDEIYVCGTRGKHNPLDDSWYNYINTAFNYHDHIQTRDNSGQKYFSNAQKKDIEQKKKQDEIEKDNISTPAWIFTDAKNEVGPASPLSPSRMGDEDDGAPIISPRESSDQKSSQRKRFQRGNLTHTLLQMLPDIPADQWEDASLRYLSQTAHNIDSDIQHAIWNETAAILNHEEFSAIFGTGSNAEVPITGQANDGVLISGQIDRLLIRDTEIFIIDYKTNRPPPTNVRDVSAQYKKQLQAYAQILTKIYPNRKIRTALLWTDGPRLMEIPTDI